MKHTTCGYCGRKIDLEKEDGEILLCDCYFQEGVYEVGE